MAVIRVEKTKNYTAMSNHHLRDKNLSLKAKGLLSLMLSLPDDWKFSVKGLAAICLEGEDSIRAALQELEKQNYVKRHRARNGRGCFGDSEYEIYEQPLSTGQLPEDPEQEVPKQDTPVQDKPEQEDPTLENPVQANPIQEIPAQEDPAQINKDKRNKEEINTELSKEAAPLPAPPAQKQRYGTFQNVLLTDSEFAAFQRAWPDWQRKIDHLSGYISTTRRDYPDHYRTLVKWAKEDAAKTPAAGPKDPPRENASEQMQDILWIQGFMDAHGQEFGIRDAPDSAQGEEVMNHGQGRDPTDPAGPAPPVPKPPVPGGG